MRSRPAAWAAGRGGRCGLCHDRIPGLPHRPDPPSGRRVDLIQKGTIPDADRDFGIRAPGFRRCGLRTLDRAFGRHGFRLRDGVLGRCGSRLQGRTLERARIPATGRGFGAGADSGYGRGFGAGADSGSRAGLWNSAPIPAPGQALGQRADPGPKCENPSG